MKKIILSAFCIALLAIAPSAAFAADNPCWTSGPCIKE